MNAYGQPPPTQPHGWPQQPLMPPHSQSQQPPPPPSGLNGNPPPSLQQPPSLISQMGNMNLNDPHGPPKPVGIPPMPGVPMNQQKFMPPGPGQPMVPTQNASNGLQQPPPSSVGMNNNVIGSDNIQQRTTPTQNGQSQAANGPQSAANLYSDPPVQGQTVPPPNIHSAMPQKPQQQSQLPPAPTSQYMPPGQQQQQQQQQQIQPPSMMQQRPPNQGPTQQFGSARPPSAQPGRPPSMPGDQQPLLQQQPPFPQSGQPQFPGQHQQPGGFPPQPQQPGGFPSQPQPQQSGGFPPQPQQYMGQPPLQPSQQPFPGIQRQPPFPGQPMQQPPAGFPGAPKMPPMPQMQQQYPGQVQGMPPLPGQPPFPGQQPSGIPPQQQAPFPGQQPGVPPHMPPQPGQYPSPGGMPPHQQYAGASGPYQPAQPQMARRLDPDQMPNPIQVMSENQRASMGPFVTNQAGLVPPLVTTKYVTHDQGNSGPRFIRSSMYNVPFTAEMMKQAAVPFSVVMSPMARTLDGEIVPPIVDFGEMGPIRCIRCKAYMCPNMQFIDAGRRFQCLLCKVTTEVPQEYFKHLDHTGQREDKYERPELVLGTYEFVATKDYCRNNVPPNPPAMIFVIDVSYNNIKSGLVHLICAQMKNIIKNLPIDNGMDRSLMKVGFITYNNSVHFYNVKSNLAQPQMMVVGDIHEMFMPLLDGFLCDPEESSAVIDSLMEQIPAMFGDTRETETVLLPAIQAGMEALRASECAGKLLVFHSSLPVSEAPGKLKNRDDRNVLGTDKEKTVLAPQTNAYNNLGQECIQVGCSVDLFIFNNSYIDLATIGQVCRLTGGEIYKYTYFQADIDGHRVVQDVIKNISRPIAFDAVMRVRTSAGVRPTDFYGHFFMSNTTDMEIAAIDCDKSITVEIKHDDKLSPDENVYIQTALLYTSVGGQRRLRVFNLALKICTQMTDLFRYCDLDVMILYFAKQIMFKLMEQTPRAVKEALEARCAQILACYRKNCASPTSSGQLILPECMKLLPLYASCMMKNDAISGGSDMTCDDRSYVMQFVQIMDLPMSVTYFYPRLIPIHDVDVSETNIPDSIRCTSEKMMDDGAYVLENGVHMFIWLGLALAPEFTQSVFGAPNVQLIDTDRPGVPILDNPLSQRVRGIIDSIQAERPRCMRVTVIRQRDKLESVLRHYLIEDRGSHGAPSYVDYLCHLHKEIRALLS